jgi:hypothetical protein
MSNNQPIGQSSGSPATIATAARGPRGTADRFAMIARPLDDQFVERCHELAVTTSAGANGGFQAVQDCIDD